MINSPSTEDRSNLVQYLKIEFVSPIFYCDYDEKLFWEELYNPYFSCNSFTPDITREDSIFKNGVFKAYFYTKKRAREWKNLGEMFRDTTLFSGDISNVCALFKEYAINGFCAQMHMKDPITGLWVNIKPYLGDDLLNEITYLSEERIWLGHTGAFHDQFSFFKRNLSSLRKNKKAVVRLDMAIYEKGSSRRIKQWLEPIPCIAQFSVTDNCKDAKIFIHKDAATLEDMVNLAAFFCRYQSRYSSAYYNRLEVLTKALPRTLQNDYRKIIHEMWIKKCAADELAHIFRDFNDPSLGPIVWEKLKDPSSGHAIWETLTKQDSSPEI